MDNINSQMNNKNDESLKIIKQIKPRRIINWNTRTNMKLETDIEQIEKKLRPLMHQEITQTKISRNMCVKIIFFFLISIMAVIIANLLNEFNGNSFNFTNASLELKEKIYGQDNAINELINYYRGNIEPFHVVVFVGGSGVGKSYTGKIIKKYFLHSHNIFEYSPPLDSIRESSFDKLSSLHCNLVILEHLTSNHLLDAVNFINSLSNLKDRPCAMILAILNPENTDDSLIKTIDLKENENQINMAFSSLNIPFKIITFNPLTSNIIDICIRNEAKNSNIQLTEQEFLEVKQHLSLMNSGCKGAYAKVQLYAKT
ncbi:hypothetical protein PV327_003198 [Microctonus hyperodae]|uniref:Uncharacterized protein n=1 Tax=Microctonus hyperodae TaxID=165561 RepID=A0AA39G409_MICHY|nr:hypothetical protein PV327_003198 [Microctonus hyperodae]